ncbi:MAG: hypothetical protein ACR65Z_05770 [Methylocystis sp.]
MHKDLTAITLSYGSRNSVTGKMPNIAGAFGKAAPPSASAEGLPFSGSMPAPAAAVDLWGELGEYAKH